MLMNHRYLRLRRTWVDCSSSESRRSGVLLYRPGRKLLRGGVWLLSKMTWFPWPGNATFAEILPGFDLEKALGTAVDFATIYTGNGSQKSKYTLFAQCSDGDAVIIKLGCTIDAKEAIRNECTVLRALQDCGVADLTGRVPVCLSEGAQGKWNWSAQSVLPRGESPNSLRQEHRDFLEMLKRAHISHGDFTPWNCSIVDGRLVVWDWEDAHTWREGEDETHFKCQVERLLMKKDG